MDTEQFFLPDWPVIYMDNHLLALYKPAGLLIQGDQSGEPSLLDLGKEWIRQRFRKPGEVFLGLVHRLDRPVAGVVLFCRTSKAASRISEQFRTGQAIKIYWALVQGRLSEKEGRLSHHLIRKPGLSSVIADHPCAGSQEARLTYRVLGWEGGASLLEIRLETGRHHQIRSQMSHVGHPVLGDLRYGAAAPLPQRQIALLARELTVSHPTLRTPIHLRCPLPRGWPWHHGPEAPADIPWNWSQMVFPKDTG